MKVFYYKLRYLRILMIVMSLIAMIGLGIFVYPYFRNEAAIPTSEFSDFPQDTQMQIEPKSVSSVPE
ncbi:MAG: hypothetical protein AB8H47_03230 [Bacteroidia bacterium]